MAVLFNITHDANNLDEYDSVVTDGGDLHTGTPGLAGTAAKMECLIDDTNELRATKAFAATAQFRVRLYVDPNGLTIPDEGEISIHQAYPGTTFYYLILEYTDAAGYNLRFYSLDDLGANAIDDKKIITDDVHYVEIHQVRATNAESSDGTVEWWVDGVSEGSAVGIDNYNKMADAPMSLRLCARNITANTSGEYFLDEFTANDDGSEIGPVAPPTGNPWYVYAQQQ